RGLPRYRSGHAGHVAAVRERLARLPPLAIAGAGFDGAGVSACVKSGREAARLVLDRMGVNPGPSARGQPRGDLGGLGGPRGGAPGFPSNSFAFAMTLSTVNPNS